MRLGARVVSTVNTDSESADLTAGLDTLLARRYSCRAFLPRPVPRATIERILAIAQRTASWCNAQPWHVIVTSGAGTERLRAAFHHYAAAAHAAGRGPQYDYDPPREYQGIYLQRRRECGLQLYGSLGIGKADRAAAARQVLENFRFFGAPHVAIVTCDESLRTYGAIDCGGYVATFLLAATSLGVATIAQAAVASQSGFLREYLALSEDRKILCGISFGYADEQHPANRFRTTRAAVADAVTWLEQ
jgi:nitroreductase